MITVSLYDGYRRFTNLIHAKDSDRSSFGYDYSSDSNSDSDEFLSGDESTTSNSAESTRNGNGSGTSVGNNDVQGSDSRHNEGVEESYIQPEEEDELTDSDYEDSYASSYCSECGKTCETLEDDAYSLASGDLEILNNLASEVHNVSPHPPCFRYLSIET